jgi:HEAT repeat protein
MTSQMEDWLAGGDLRSDGASNEVADLVRDRLDLLPDLLQALRSSDPVVRGRAADALEKVARVRQEAIVPHVKELIETGLHDDVPMVRWHIAMLLGHLSGIPSLRPQLLTPLLDLLQDESVFVASWAITSLCLIAYLDPGTTSEIVPAIGRLQHSPSVALRTRARKALAALTDPRATIPPNWIKSESVKSLVLPSSASPPA